MRAFLRKCRGALGITVTWGAVWAAIFVTLVVVIGVLDPESIDLVFFVCPVGAAVAAASIAIAKRADRAAEVT